MTQLGFPGVDSRPRSKRAIYPPGNLAPVADGFDPEHGPFEISPCPPLDTPGTVYVVGLDHARWSVGADGLVDGSGSAVPMRAGIEEMKRLGARIVFSPGAWGPDRVRPSLSAPLLETTCQAPWFMRRDCEEVPCTR